MGSKLFHVCLCHATRDFTCLHASRGPIIALNHPVSGLMYDTQLHDVILLDDIHGNCNARFLRWSSSRELTLVHDIHDDEASLVDVFSIDVLGAPCKSWRISLEGNVRLPETRMLVEEAISLVVSHVEQRPHDFLALSTYLVGMSPKEHIYYDPCIRAVDC